MNTPSDKEKTDKLIYKRHSVVDLYHKKCGTFVSGNGSDVLPYKCLCEMRLSV